MTLGYDMIWVNDSNLLRLIHMGTYKINYNMLDMIVSSYNNKKLEVSIIINDQAISFIHKLADVHRLIGLP